MITKLPNDEEMLSKLESGFASLDEQRAKGLLRMSDFQVTQTKMLEKEQLRLEKKYSADHPKVRKITVLCGMYERSFIHRRVFYLLAMKR